MPRRPEGIGIGDADVLAIQRELPAMEAAGDLPQRAEIVTDELHATMRANIIEGAQRPLVVTDDDVGFRPYVEPDIVDGILAVRHDAAAQPNLGPEIIKYTESASCRERV